MRKISSDRDSVSSREPQSWHAIDWQRIERFVRTTQKRITKATQESDWRRVKALQRSLTHSFSARALAVRRVTENSGKRTAGVDRELWNTPDQKWSAVLRLKQQRGYRPKPLRRVYIPKSNGKERPLGIPTMSDRAQQALHLLGLEPVSETLSDPNSYGFRRNRSTADAMGQLFLNLSRRDSSQWVLEADIAGCFDHINHEWLTDHVRMNKTILRKWLKAGVVHKGQFQRTDEGTPQGGVISPTLANVTLNGLETQLHTYLRAVLGAKKAVAQKVHVTRYADDFVVTGVSQEILEATVKPWVVSFLAQRGLRLSLEKTKVLHIDQGFDFLGWNFRKYCGTLLIKPSKKSATAFYRKVREIIRGHSGVAQEVLLSKLNPVLTGWAKYHQPVVAKETFSRMDSLINRLLMRWAKKRHRNKTLAWCFQRYWLPNGERRDFAVPFKNEDGVWQLNRLYRLADTPIRRHKKIKGGYNPFDPEWEHYGEQLRTERMVNNLSYQKQLVSLYMSQKGACALCGTALGLETGWHDHHLVRRVDGGSDLLSNRVLLHPVCHARLHALGLNVVKPVPTGT